MQRFSRFSAKAVGRTLFKHQPCLLWRVCGSCQTAQDIRRAGKRNVGKHLVWTERQLCFEKISADQPQIRLIRELPGQFFIKRLIQFHSQNPASAGEQFPGNVAFSGADFQHQIAAGDVRPAQQTVD